MISAQKPLVSVVIAAYNDAAHLEECLDALAAQDYGSGHYEVLVVDDGSTDGTADVARERTGVRCFQQTNAGPGSARNLGVEQARGEIVAFTDSDCVPETGWLSALVSAFDSGGENLGAVGGPHLGHPEDPPFARRVELFLRSIGWATGYIKGHAERRLVTHVPSCNAAYRKQAFLRAGGFRPGLFPGEDVDLDRRLHQHGYCIVFNPEARVLHHRPANPAAWRRMLCSYGESSGNNIRLHGFFRLVHFLPPMLLGNLLFLMALCWFTPLGWGLALGEVLALMALCAHWGHGTMGFLCALRFLRDTMLHYSLGYWKRLLCFHPLPLPARQEDAPRP